MFDLDRWEEIWQTISRNRKRSIMTAFGVFWGIFMLTIMLGAGLGLKNALFSQLGDMSVNSCFFWGGRTSIPYKGLPSGRYWQFENEDLAAIKKQVPNVRSVGSVIWGSEYKFSRNDKKGDYSLVGYNPDFQQISPQPIRFGRFFNEIDMEQQRKVCILPVLPQNEELKGASAVIEKDLTSGLMAEMLNADMLMILTSVENVSINYGTPDEKPLEHITVADAKKYIAEGQFGENSMLPKMEAAVSFLEKGIGRTAVITSIDSALAGFQGKTGTIIE